MYSSIRRLSASSSTTKTQPFDIVPAGDGSKTKLFIKPLAGCNRDIDCRSADELQPVRGVGIVRAMDSVRRACMRLGIAATISLLLALAVMMFLVEAPQVATWFMASAALAAAAYLTAVVAAYLEG